MVAAGTAIGLSAFRTSTNPTTNDRIRHVDDQERPPGQRRDGVPQAGYAPTEPHRAHQHDRAADPASTTAGRSGSEVDTAGEARRDAGHPRGDRRPRQPQQPETAATVRYRTARGAEAAGVDVYLDREQRRSRAAGAPLCDTAIPPQRGPGLQQATRRAAWPRRRPGRSIWPPARGRWPPPRSTSSAS